MSFFIFHCKQIKGGQKNYRGKKGKKEKKVESVGKLFFGSFHDIFSIYC